MANPNSHRGTPVTVDDKKLHIYHGGLSSYQLYDVCGNTMVTISDPDRVKTLDGQQFKADGMFFTDWDNFKKNVYINKKFQVFRMKEQLVKSKYPNLILDKNALRMTWEELLETPNRPCRIVLQNGYTADDAGAIYEGLHVGASKANMKNHKGKTPKRSDYEGKPERIEVKIVPSDYIEMQRKSWQEDYFFCSVAYDPALKRQRWEDLNDFRIKLIQTKYEKFAKEHLDKARVTRKEKDEAEKVRKAKEFTDARDMLAKAKEEGWLDKLLGK